MCTHTFLGQTHLATKHVVRGKRLKAFTILDLAIRSYMGKSFGKIADPYPEEDDVKFCELLLKYFKGVIPEPLLSRLKENIPFGAWSIFCTPESFMNLPPNPVFPDDKKSPQEKKETHGAIASGFQSSQDGAASSSQTLQNSSSSTQETLYIKEIEGAAETYPRQKIAYKVIRYNKERNEVSDEEKKEIKWAVKIGDSDNSIIKLKDKGEKIILDIKPEWDGKEIKDILVMAYIEGTKEANCNTHILQDPYKGVLIRGVVGGDNASIGQNVEYKVVNSNQDGDASQVSDGSDVKWAIKVGKDGIIDREELKDMRWKKIITLKMKPEWAKDGMITVMPYMNSPTETVSVKTRVEKLELPIVIDRYKMPGLNEDGSDIADDMCFGEKEKMPRPIYKRAIIEKYIKEYEDGGFSEIKHKNFSNNEDYGNRIYPKAIYKIADNPIGKYWLLDYSDEKLFAIFREMATEIFSRSDSDMRENINAMIDKFENDEGGIYENEKLTNKIKNHPSTVRYCQQLERYIKRKLKNDGCISQLKDKKVDFKYKGKNARDDRKENKGKDFDVTPVYDALSFSLKKLLDKEKWDNTFGGTTIALNDIWATEVMITEYKLTGSKYTVKYQVTLWDHFGLDVEDIAREKPQTFFDGFYAWFHLQHYRGYRPFITKITFERSFNGDLKDEIE